MKKGDNAPATKRDLESLASQIAGLETGMRAFQERIDAKLDHHKQELIHEFYVAVETQRHDLLSAGRDDVESIKDRQHKLEQRVSELERSAGLATR